MKKVLFVAHVDSHIRHFHLPYLKYFKEKGYEVHVATSNNENDNFPNCDVKHNIPMQRNPFKLDNLKAYRELKKIIKNENFDIIHCHTPVGGVLTRLASINARKQGTKVLYTAHGFHFYKGASKKNWILYYPIEKFLSRFTDVLITMNNEDYKIAKNKFHAKSVKFVHGMGVDANRFNTNKLTNEEKKQYAEELEINEKDFIIMYVGELNKNKNQIILIENFKKILERIPNAKCFLIGNGDLQKEYVEKIEELGLENKIKLTGYRKDTDKILKLANVYVATSLREGLPLNLIEAGLIGLPILGKKIRGNIEIIKDGENGFLFTNTSEMIEEIVLIAKNKELREKFKKNARNSVMEYSLENALKEGIKIYEEI